MTAAPQNTPGDTPDAVLFVVSAYVLSTRSLNRLESAAVAATDLPARLIRLEDTGPNLIKALDQFRAEGKRHIRVQPLGYPFPETLLNWLPGVLADWRQRGDNADTHITLGADALSDPAQLSAAAAAALAPPAAARSVAGTKPRLGKPGWTDPPDFDFHLLLCTGPRCAVHGAASAIHLLKEELQAAGVAKRCLITQTACVYPCNRGPVLVLYPHGHWYHLPDRPTIRRFVREVLLEGGRADDLRFYTTRRGRAGAERGDAPPPRF